MRQLYNGMERLLSMPLGFFDTADSGRIRKLVSLIPVVLSVAGFSIMMTREGKKFMQWYFDALEEMSNEAVEYVRGVPVAFLVFSLSKNYQRRSMTDLCNTKLTISDTLQEGLDCIGEIKAYNYEKNILTIWLVCSMGTSKN